MPLLSSADLAASHAEAPVHASAKHVFLERVAGPSADPYPFALRAQVWRNTVLDASARRQPEVKVSR